ncbi:hypothetical protein BKA61DRAFT_155390 [Leptodontidium sp. MPI-SDFR-AT-0119]|nr:hypothetical protein BKA61DRAFT_155390 [Leptodontidium sp. MPI-SDFR-AT-0119]
MHLLLVLCMSNTHESLAPPLRVSQSLRYAAPHPILPCHTVHAMLDQTLRRIRSLPDSYIPDQSSPVQSSLVQPPIQPSGRSSSPLSTYLLGTLHSPSQAPVPVPAPAPAPDLAHAILSLPPIHPCLPALELLPCLPTTCDMPCLREGGPLTSTSLDARTVLLLLCPACPALYPAMPCRALHFPYCMHHTRSLFFCPSFPTW